MYVFIPARKGQQDGQERDKRRSVQGVYQEFEHLESLTRTGGWDTMGKGRAEGGGRENWMCSKACGQVVSRARASLAVLARRHVENHVERFSPSFLLPRLSGCGRHCLFFPILSSFCCAGRSSVCVVAMPTIVSGKVVRTQKYQTSLLFFFVMTCPPWTGVTRGSRGRYLRPSQRGCGDMREFAPPKRLLFIAALLSAIHASVSVLIGSETLFISTGRWNVRGIQRCVRNLEEILQILFEFYKCWEIRRFNGTLNKINITSDIFAPHHSKKLIYK